MPADQVQLVLAQTQAVPLNYTVPQAQAAELVAANAVYDGTAAAGAWKPALEIYSDSGHLVSRSIGDTQAAGAQAGVTFAPFLRAATAAGGTAAIRDDILLLGYGMFAETYRREYRAGSHQLATGRAYYFPIGLAVGDVVTGFVVHHVTGGTLTTFYRLALYTPDGGSRVARTADRTADAGTVGYLTFPLDVAYTVPTQGVHWIGVIQTYTGAGTFYLIVGNDNPAAWLAPPRATFNAMLYTDAGPLADLPAAFSKAALGNPPAGLNPHWIGAYT